MYLPPSPYLPTYAGDFPSWAQHPPALQLHPVTDAAPDGPLAVGAGPAGELSGETDGWGTDCGDTDDDDDDDDDVGRNEDDAASVELADVWGPEEEAVGDVS